MYSRSCGLRVAWRTTTESRPSNAHPGSARGLPVRAQLAYWAHGMRLCRKSTQPVGYDELIT
eukprot:6214016-Pleurochrysis_carterae.AAC.2